MEPELQFKPKQSAQNQYFPNRVSSYLEVLPGHFMPVLISDDTTQIPSKYEFVIYTPNASPIQPKHIKQILKTELEILKANNELNSDLEKRIKNSNMIFQPIPAEVCMAHTIENAVNQFLQYIQLEDEEDQMIITYSTN